MLHCCATGVANARPAESIEEALALGSANRTRDVIIHDYRLREQRTGVELIKASA